MDHSQDNENICKDINKLIVRDLELLIKEAQNVTDDPHHFCSHLAYHAMYFFMVSQELSGKLKSESCLEGIDIIRKALKNAGAYVQELSESPSNTHTDGPLKQ